MDNNFLHKVYSIFNEFIHPNTLRDIRPENLRIQKTKLCPVTGLDISMQPKNSKFLSSKGVRWYYEHHYKVYEEKLSVFLTNHWKESAIEDQYREIAHHIRNADSNPRNNTKRAIKKILEDTNCLFNNRDLIDRNKLKEAGMVDS